MRYLLLWIVPLLASPASAKENEADSLLKACVEAPANLDAAGKEKHFATCITAFDRAIVEAQRSDSHSPARRRLYWMQASQANAISVLHLLERESAFTEYVCDIAKLGIQAWAQVDPKASPSDVIQVPQTLVVAYRECKSFWQ